jgi:hypothetical protein
MNSGSHDLISIGVDLPLADEMVSIWPEKVDEDATSAVE